MYGELHHVCAAGEGFGGGDWWDDYISLDGNRRVLGCANLSLVWMMGDEITWRFYHGTSKT